MFKKIDILYFVEHKDRELEISREVCKDIRSSNPYLTTRVASLIFHVFFCMLFYRPRIVITPSPAFGRGSVSRIYNFIYGDEVKFLNLNYEQYVGEWESKLKLNWHKVSKDKQFHICWDSEFKKKILSMNVKKDNVLSTDRPHDWLVQNKYKNKNSIDIKRKLASKPSLPINKQWAFIAMTDGIAFLNQGKINQVVNRGVPKEQFLNNIEIVSNQIMILIKWIKDFEDNGINKDLIFILRPHPSVGYQDYLNLIKKNNLTMPKNLFFTKDFHATDWIFASDFYITNYSTLALDAKALGKRLFYIDPISCPSNYRYWWLKNVKKVTSFKNFVLNLERSSNNNLPQEQEKNLTNNSIKQTSQAIQQILDVPNKKQITLRPHFVLFVFALLFFPKRIFGSLFRNIIIKTSLLKKTNLLESLSHDYFKIK